MYIDLQAIGTVILGAIAFVFFFAVWDALEIGEAIGSRWRRFWTWVGRNMLLPILQSFWFLICLPFYAFDIIFQATVLKPMHRYKERRGR